MQTTELLQLKERIIATYGEEYYYALLSSSSVFKRTYRNDRVAFVHDCFSWRPNQKPTEYQLDALGILDSGVDRLAIQSLHGVGKTTLMSFISLHYALTRELEDWKALATASAWRQLEKYYFPEVRKWSRALLWSKVGRYPFNERTELQKLNLTLSTGGLSCIASDNPDLIEGAHADNLLYLFDESKAIPAATFDAAEGAFSGGGVSGNEAIAVAVSTPGDPSGRFYDICRKAPGLEKWKVKRIKVEDGIKAGRISPVWVEDMRKLWGEKSATFRNKVLGEFAAQDENSVIPLAWVEAAFERYEDLRIDELAPEDLPALTSVGVDVGDGGGDYHVIAPRYGNIVTNLYGYVAPAQSQVELANKVAYRIDSRGEKTTALAIVDSIGVGSGVTSVLESLGYQVAPFIASGGTDVKDVSGKFGFLNLRALAYWNMRELLNPERGNLIALPRIEELQRDLTTPKWFEVAGAKIKIESKEDIRKRLDGASTDYGDAVCIAFLAEYLEPKTAMSW